MVKRPDYSNIEFIKDLWHFFKIHKGQFIFFSVFLIISVLLGLVPPLILAKIIDFFTIGEIGEIKIFYYLLGALLGVTVVGTFIRHTAKYYLTIFMNKVQKHAKVESFQKLMQGDLIWHDKENTGNKMQKIHEGESAIARFMNFYVNKGIQIVIESIGIIAIFAYFNLKYALVAILYVGIYLFVEYQMNKRVAKTSFEIKLVKEKAAGKAYEFSSNIATIKSLGIEKSSSKQIHSREDAVLQAKMKRRKVSTQKWLTVQLIAALFYALFIFLVGKDIIVGVLTIGSIIIYVEYVRKLKNVLNTISVEANDLIDTKYSIYRMMEIYKTIPEIEEDENVKKLKDWKEIKLKGISFKYKDEGVLDKFNLDIRKGEKIGIVGKSGSGKSTFFKLLLKLYLPQKGMIYFDSKPITSIKRDSILNKVSIVPQETELFNLSLKENIIISGGGRINKKRYQKALKDSQLNSVVSKLKGRDFALIGEKGVRLSGGERQRLGIARAIYKDSDIIIFDEATSNLDYQTEKEIQKSIDKLKDKTLIVSAHRIQTLKNMDKIVFIDKGRIIEEGTYDELLKKRGQFYKLWEQQGAWRN
tara:strand:+ start:1210 stop:2964 length:1755 start_codon:yes stop_codon:yes gene_type:complete